MSLENLPTKPNEVGPDENTFRESAHEKLLTIALQTSGLKRIDESQEPSGKGILPNLEFDALSTVAAAPKMTFAPRNEDPYLELIGYEDDWENKAYEMMLESHLEEPEDSTGRPESENNRERIESMFQPLTSQELTQSRALVERDLSLYRSADGGSVLDKLRNSGLPPKHVDLVLNLMAEVRENYARTATNGVINPEQKGSWLHSIGELAEVMDVAKINKLTPDQTRNAAIAAMFSDSVKSGWSKNFGGNFFTHHLDGALAAEIVLSRQAAELLSKVDIEAVTHSILEHQIGPAQFMGAEYAKQIISGVNGERENELESLKKNPSRNAEEEKRFSELTNLSDAYDQRAAELKAHVDAQQKTELPTLEREWQIQELEKRQQYGRFFTAEEVAKVAGVRDAIANPLRSDSEPDPRGGRRLAFDPEQRELLRRYVGSGTENWHVPDQANEWAGVSQTLRTADGFDNYFCQTDSDGKPVKGPFKIAQLRGPLSVTPDADIHETILAIQGSEDGALGLMNESERKVAESRSQQSKLVYAEALKSTESFIRQRLSLAPDQPLPKVPYWNEKLALPGATASQEEKKQFAQKPEVKFAVEIHKHFADQLLLMRQVNPAEKTPEIQSVRGRAESAVENLENAKSNSRDRALDDSGRPLSEGNEARVARDFAPLTRVELRASRSLVEAELSQYKSNDGTDNMSEKFRESGLTVEQRARILDIMAEVRENYARQTVDGKLKPEQQGSWLHSLGELGEVIEVARANGLSPAQTEKAIIAALFSDSSKNGWTQALGGNFFTHHLDGALAAKTVLSRNGYAPEIVTEVVNAILEHQISPPKFMGMVYAKEVADGINAQRNSEFEKLKEKGEKAFTPEEARRWAELSKLSSEHEQRVKLLSEYRELLSNEVGDLAKRLEHLCDETQRRISLGQFVTEIEAKNILELQDAIGDPLNPKIPRETDSEGRTRLLFNEEQRKMLREHVGSGTENWYVPDESKPWHKVSYILVVADTLDNYFGRTDRSGNPTGGPFKIAALRGPLSVTPDSCIDKAIGSIQKSEKSSLSLMNEQDKKRAEERAKQSEKVYEVAKQRTEEWIRTQLSLPAHKSLSPLGKDKHPVPYWNQELKLPGPDATAEERKRFAESPDVKFAKEIHQHFVDELLRMRRVAGDMPEDIEAVRGKSKTELREVDYRAVQVGPNVLETSLPKTFEFGARQILQSVASRRQSEYEILLKKSQEYSLSQNESKRFSELKRLKAEYDLLPDKIAFAARVFEREGDSEIGRNAAISYSAMQSELERGPFITEAEAADLKKTGARIAGLYSQRRLEHEQLHRKWMDNTLSSDEAERLSVLEQMEREHQGLAGKIEYCDKLIAGERDPRVKDELLQKRKDLQERQKLGPYITELEADVLLQRPSAADRAQYARTNHPVFELRSKLIVDGVRQIATIEMVEDAYTRVVNAKTPAERKQAMTLIEVLCLQQDVDGPKLRAAVNEALEAKARGTAPKPFNELALSEKGSAEKRSSSGKVTAGVGIGVGLGTTLTAGLAWLSSRQGKQPGPLVDRAPKLESKNKNNPPG